MIKLKAILMSVFMLAVPALVKAQQNFSSGSRNNGVGGNLSHYQVCTGTARSGGAELAVIRSMELSGKLNYLAVDPMTLSTKLLPASDADFRPMSWPQLLSYFNKAPYVRAVQAAQGQSALLQDAGIVHGFPKEKGVTLTIDLCPSHKPLDRIIFTTVISEFKKIEQPVPVALSVTGRFMLSHGEDLSWLKELERSGEVSITWINHTYNHHFNPTAPLKTNFILEPGTDLNFEILGTEMAMLQNGLQPSVFFRFPGLVSDQAVVSKVLSYGLIPIGSDAWLAKGQPANAGSIVLIHGNGNEPVGVKDFIQLLKTEKAAVTGKQWLMYDLRESVEDEFQ